MLVYWRVIGFKGEPTLHMGNACFVTKKATCSYVHLRRCWCSNNFYKWFPNSIVYQIRYILIEIEGSIVEGKHKHHETGPWCNMLKYIVRIGKYGWYSCIPISRTESFVCTLKVEGLRYPSIARGFHPMWDDSQFDWKSFFSWSEG